MIHIPRDFQAWETATQRFAAVPFACSGGLHEGPFPQTMTRLSKEIRSRTTTQVRTKERPARVIPSRSNLLAAH